MVKEWNLLRVFASLSVVLLHSTTQISRLVGHPQYDLYYFFRIILNYATPTFIVLSIIILANRYPNRLPDNFWAGRIKYIYLPFVFFGVLDAFVRLHFNPNLKLDQKILDNILTGKFEGWFILVIFQLYILHYMVIRFKLSMVWMFPLSLVVMAIYLSFITGDVPSMNGLEYTLKLPFFAWFGYFTAAFLIGKNYKYLSGKLLKYRWFTLFLLVVSLGIVYLGHRSGISEISSRRLDLYPLVLSVTSVILAWGQLIPQSKIINTISNYSFGIYLLHWQVQRFMAPYVAEYVSYYIPQVLVLLIGSTVVSMLIIKLISMLPFGQFLVGKTKRNKPKKLQENTVPGIA